MDIVRGVALVARGRADGLACFSGTPQGVLSSMAPLLALPLAALIAAPRASWPHQLTDFLMEVCALLAAPVMSHALARLLGREALWARYAAAVNWCQWALPAVALILCLTLGGLVLASGANPDQASFVVLAVLLPYAMWLQWFIARNALALNGAVAAAVALGVNLGVVAVVLAPKILAAQAGLPA